MSTAVTDRTGAPGRAETELAGALLATLRRIGRSAGMTAQHGVVTPERARLLWHIRDRALRSGDLAQRCALTPSAVSELVDILVRDGLARRAEDSADRRVVLVEITGRGRRELDRVHAVMTERVAQLLSKLTAEKRARLRSAIADLEDALDALNRETTSAR
jgi:DNA-binding MarR family transcriptional regulator